MTRNKATSIWVSIFLLSNLVATEAEALTLYIVRHGKTMLNITDRVQGWSDAVLTPAGEETVRAAGRGLAAIPFQAAYSSDSGRAMQTARLILAENPLSSDLHLSIDPRLREFGFGTYEGALNHVMWTDIAADQGRTLQDFLKNMDPRGFADSVARLDARQVGAPGNWPAENYGQITARLSAGLAEIERREEARGNGNVLIVSHGLSIIALLDTLFPGFKPPEGGLRNASVTIVTVQDGEHKLESVNDLSFVEAGK